jgi:DNA-directed RNA polymerase specialized sigma24 family protein
MAEPGIDRRHAFQGTFLVLARKAASIKPKERVANWLHGVALRTAMKARTMTAKQRRREKQVTDNLPKIEDRSLNYTPRTSHSELSLADTFKAARVK